METLNLDIHSNTTSSFNVYQLNQFDIGKTIADSIYGKFRLATHKKTKEEVIFQIIEMHLHSDTEELKRIETNIKNYRRIKHESVAQLLSIIQTKQAIYLIFSKLQGISAMDYIINNDNYLHRRSNN